MQSRCLHNVRTAFNLMQSDLDPLLKGKSCSEAKVGRLCWCCDSAGKDLTVQMPFATLQVRKL